MQQEQLLLDAIREDRDDLESYAVYGDWLAQRGDPRGELIGLSLALERAPADEKLAKRVKQLTAAQAKTLPRGIDVTWRRGFVSELRLAPVDGDLLDVLRDPRLQLVHTVSLIHRDLEFGNRKRTYVYPGLVARLVAAAPRSLRRLEIGDSSSPVFASIVELQNLFDQFPRLVELALHSRTLPNGLVEYLAPRIHALELGSAWVTDKLMREITRVSWPHLRALALHMPWRERSGDKPSLLAPLMRGDTVPALVDLRLREHAKAGGTTERFCADIVRSPLLARLEVLDFTVRGLDVEIVRPSHPKLRHLKRFLPSAEDETDPATIQQLTYLLEEPDTHRAIALCHKVRALSNDEFDLHNINRRLGTALALVGDLDGALAALDASLANEATCGVTLIHKAWTLKRLARYEEASMVLEQAEQTYRHPPSQHSRMYLRASLDAARGKPVDASALDLARQLFVGEIETRVVDADLHYELTCVHGLMNNSRAMLETLAATFELCPHYREWARTEIDFAKFRESEPFIALIESR